MRRRDLFTLAAAAVIGAGLAGRVAAQAKTVLKAVDLHPERSNAACLDFRDIHAVGNRTQEPGAGYETHV